MNRVPDCEESGSPGSGDCDGKEIRERGRSNLPYEREERSRSREVDFGVEGLLTAHETNMGVRVS